MLDCWKAIALEPASHPQIPAAAELFHDFCGRPETTQVGVTVENRFFRGFQHAEIDWNKPVHGLLVDFKGRQYANWNDSPALGGWDPNFNMSSWQLHFFLEFVCVVFTGSSCFFLHVICGMPRGMP